MKKTLLLSIAASAVLFAGGDIVEPAPITETAPCATSNLKWYGQTVLYYQSAEDTANLNTLPVGVEGELFDGNTAQANVGLKLGVTGSNLLGTGLGFGAEVIYLTTLGLETEADGVNQTYVRAPMQLASQTGELNSGELTQAYLSYTLDNTTVKVGRMELPQSLSPFAFSETWSVFANTFDAALLVNTDLPDTTLVLAYVMNANQIGNLSVWDEIGVNGGLRPGNDGAFMVTAQNKSVQGLELTGSFYYIAESSPLAGENNAIAAWAGGLGDAEDVMALWGDAKFMMPVAGHDIGFGVQGGMVDVGNTDPTIAYGAKAMGKFNFPAFGNVALCAAYTGVDMGGMVNGSITNVGTGVKTPLYTQMVANQNWISGANSNFGEANTMMIKASATYDLPALGNVGLSVAYSNTEIVNGMPGVPTLANPFLSNNINQNDFAELDVVATTKLGGAEVLAAYVNRTQDADVAAAVGEMDDQIVRVWAKWNF